MPLEILSLEGFRIDGRRWNELRRFSAKIGFHAHADGSSYVEQGNTKVICMVYGPIEPIKNKSIDRERIIVDISIATFSSLERKKRTRSDK
ncbi:hypothetical protein PCK2_000194 [Pneumocystis canis]|nr:hypothetical protein PCK2_000194 [Pneumocystis canis]